eukprot:TRINITY_DN9490_c0_g1_i1.p1 TRINITY_DN9490_c0_g1~~TRINITY_DN9490_c0_g1_i1.p1  ORF type:complete len:107 (-),score=13.33 TRINITY_DN9490_c0_g1_i1:145-465(-)
MRPAQKTDSQWEQSAQDEEEPSILAATAQEASPASWAQTRFQWTIGLAVCSGILFFASISVLAVANSYTPESHRVEHHLSAPSNQITIVHFNDVYQVSHSPRPQAL